ncbi:MAG: peptidase S24 [Bacteroides sp.]|nr:peptidase S24 [Bacteroides sp.]
MTLKERIFLLIKKEGLNPNQFYIKSGLGNGYLDKVGAVLRKPTLKKIEETFPHWNIDWIIQEEGEMYREVKKVREMPNAVLMAANHVMYVPFVNQYAYAGYTSGYADNTYMDSLPTIPFIADHEGRGNYIVFEVKGDSMNDGTEDSYLEGDKLLCREIAPHLWADSKLHIRKWDFVIVHTDGILIKQILDHDVENHTITIHSLNDMYPDRKIDLCDVRQLFNVIELQRAKRR